MSIALRLGLSAAVILAAAACGDRPSYNERTKSYRTPLEANALPDDGGDTSVLPADSDADSADFPANGGDGDGTPAAETDGTGTGDTDASDQGDQGDPATMPAPATPVTTLPGLDDPVVAEKLKGLPKFGLLVNDLECGLCHVSVVGDVVSTRRVPALWQTSDAALTGRWLAADLFDAATPVANDPQSLGLNVVVNAVGGIHTNYRGVEMPLDQTGDGVPDFPSLNFAALPAQMIGSVATQGSYATNVQKIWNGNLVLTGTKDQPIVLKDDVFITGDLVIKGWYTGVGSLYVQGNVYIPGDLRAMRTAFPFSSDDGQAVAKAADVVRAQTTDALGIATAKSVFIGDIQKHQNSDAGNEAVNVYNHPATPANRRAEALGVLNVLAWFPGGQPAFDALYDMAVSCETQAATQIGSFNMVEAFLYAQNTVAGISRRASYSIRGGVIADYFHIVSGAAKCQPVASPVHGRPSDRSYIEYDFRMRTGIFRLLEHVGALFPKDP